MNRVKWLACSSGRVMIRSSRRVIVVLAVISRKTTIPLLVPLQRVLGGVPKLKVNWQPIGAGK